MQIKYAELTDLPALAKVHRRAFPTSLATAMGQSYVEKMLEWFIVCPSTYIFYYEIDNKIVGYCSAIIRDGSLSTGATSGMLQHSFRAAIKTMIVKPWLFLHPEMKHRYGLMVRNILRRFFPPKRNISVSSVNTSKKNASVGLVSIGVDPVCFSKGIGSAMIREFEKKALELGISHIDLSVLIHNERAIKAYERNGWQKGETNGKSLSMYKILDLK